MDRDHVLATLRAHEDELRKVGVTRLSLFGSTARGENRVDSDVDLLAVFDPSRRVSLLDVVGIQLQLAEILGVPVDLSEEERLQPRVRENVLPEKVLAF